MPAGQVKPVEKSVNWWLSPMTYPISNDTDDRQATSTSK